MPVNFHHLTPALLIKRKILKGFIQNLFKREGKELEMLDIIFCTDDYLLEINQNHLSHNYYTDIITFDLSPTKNAPTIGELYISIDRVKDNANTHQVTFTNELHRVIFHGSLHLCGYKDKKEEDIAVMRKMEERYLGLYFNN